MATKTNANPAKDKKTTKAKTTKKPKSQSKTDQPQAKKIAFSSKLSWLPKKTFELEITIPSKIVKDEYKLALKDLIKDTTVKGFRKGNAPENLVEKQIGKSKIYDKIIDKVITIAYFAEIKKHNLKPIINPQVTPIAMPENKDWVVKASSCEMPEVKLKDYKKAIKNLKAKSTIWTPEKATKQEGVKTDEKPIIDDNQILDEFIKNVTIELPDLLVQEEANRLIADMVDQIKAAGLTVQQYLESRKLTQETLKKNYQEFATKSLTLEFAVAQVAQEEKIEVDQKEIDTLVKATNDPKARERLKDPNQLNYLKLVLRKQKTIDFIKSL